MRDLLSWNVSFGRWGGVHVRLHVFFLLFAIVSLHLSTQDPQNSFLVEASIALAVLLFSVLAHEFGHCVAAWKVGGSADQIVVWPLGGLAHVNVSHEPQQELVTALAGPLVNFSICMLIAPAVVVFGGDIVALMNPFVPPIDAKGQTWLIAICWVFWVNWLLAIVNLLPAFPLDGGRVLRSLLWRRLGYRPSVVRVAQVAKLTAFGLCVGAVLVHGRYPFASLPLALFGIFLFFSAKQEAERLHDHESDEGVFGYDFSQGYTSLEKAPPVRRDSGPIRKFLDTRREARRVRRQELEAEEERRVDEVLARLHEKGLDGLSEEDRALLSRVSARYRDRLRG